VPVLTLWAAVVARRLGFAEDEALTLGKAVAGLNAQAKGRRLGIFKPHEEKAKKVTGEGAGRVVLARGKVGRMRLWSLHPSLLDAKGLVALWREALLAQRVLQGNTTGYRAHPQLHRFRQSADPLGVISTYLWAVHDEATRRGYAFGAAKIALE
jgi:hypothetical protein